MPAIRKTAAKRSPKNAAVPSRAELAWVEKALPLGSKSLIGFSPQFSWYHYRALMRIDKAEARNFHERSRGEVLMWAKQ